MSHEMESESDCFGWLECFARRNKKKGCLIKSQSKAACGVCACVCVCDTDFVACHAVHAD